jgi:hypothetical protein
VAPAKFFRLSIGNEVRLKNAYIIKAESVVKIVRALLLKYMLLMTMLVVVVVGVKLRNVK